RAGRPARGARVVSRPIAPFPSPLEGEGQGGGYGRPTPPSPALLRQGGGRETGSAQSAASPVVFWPVPIFLVDWPSGSSAGRRSAPILNTAISFVPEPTAYRYFPSPDTSRSFVSGLAGPRRLAVPSRVSVPSAPMSKALTELLTKLAT